MSKEAEIIGLLAHATASGKQKWEPTAIDENFATTVGDVFSVNIMATPDPENPSRPDVMIELRDQEGRVAVSVVNSTQEVSYELLRGLHDAARRSALKVDDTLEAMLKSLKSK